MKTSSETMIVIGGVLLTVLMVGREGRDEWRLSPSGDPGMVHFRVERSRPGSTWSHSSEVPISAFHGLNSGQSGSAKFEYAADAGSFQCQGRFSFGVGSGRYRFQPNPRFGEELQRLGYSAPRDDQYFGMAVAQVSLDFARGIRECGLRASTDQLVDLRSHGLTLAYIREIQNAGYRSLTAQDYIDMRVHGVNTDFLRALRQAGYDLPSSQVVDLKIHGVGTEFVRELDINRLKPPAADLVQMKMHGLDPAFLSEARDLGYTFTTQQLIDLRMRGVNGDYLRNLKAAGAPALPAHEIADLKVHGIDPAFLREAKESGYTFSTRELIDLRARGVNGDYLRDLKAAGASTLSAREITELKVHGMDPSFLREVKELGYTFNTQELIELRRRGVSGDYLRNLKESGMRSLSARQIAQLKMHGVQ